MTLYCIISYHVISAEASSGAELQHVREQEERAGQPDLGDMMIEQQRYQVMTT